MNTAGTDGGIHRMRMQEKHAGGLPVEFLLATIMAMLSGATACGQGRTAISGQGPAKASDDPYFIVLCTDVSQSMNASDPLFEDKATGKRTTLRDDAQFTFLALLGENPTENLVGVCKFSDRISEGLPGGTSEIVPAGSALLTWQQVGADWQNVRERISTRKSDSGGTRIEAALQWARRRIGVAREQYRAKGHGIVILLSDGDPDHASHQMDGGPVLRAAADLASEDTRVYAIVVNAGSYRSGREPRRLRNADMVAEKLMDMIGDMTRGRTYRITATSSLLDIFLNIFQAAPGSPPISNTAIFDVSKHHRTVVFIGPSLESIRLEPAAGGTAGKPYILAVKDGLDEASGIDRRVVPLAKWNIMILRRPVEPGRLDGYWCGKWRPDGGGAGGKYDGRIYLITDFLLRLEMEPQSPCWMDERVRIRAHLVDRPRVLGEQTEVVPPLRGKDLSLSFVAVRGQTAAPIAVGDEWDPSERVYRSVPFQLSAPGRYTITCNCADRAQNREIPLGAFSTDVLVEPSPLSLVIHTASTGAVVFPRGEDSSQGTTVQGGEEVYAELRRQGDTTIEITDAQLHVANMTPSQRPFRPEAGRLVTEPFALPKGDKRLAGQAQVRLRVAEVARELDLPGDGFDFFYETPQELTGQFSDQRTALWVGERHRQVLHLSVFPVFPDLADATSGLFPRELPRAVMTFLGDPVGEPVVLPVQCTLDGLTTEKQDNAIRITGTYTLELGGVIPPSRRCEVDLGTILSGLQVRKKSYEVINPVSRRVFTYQVAQELDEQAQEGVAETLVTDEPIVFGAAWSPDQDVNRVTIEVREQEASGDRKSVLVVLPDAGTATSSRATRLLQKELQKDKNYEVDVVIDCKPEGADKYTTIRLPGGAFKAIDRHLKLSQLVIGSGGGQDLSCHALETMQIPLRAYFTGYTPDNPDHNRLITDFKNSCRLTTTNDSGSQDDISAGMEWTTSKEGPGRSYILEGQALYAPNRAGSHTVELTGNFDESGPAGQLRSILTAACRLSARAPRFTLKVLEIVSPDERVLFDSERLISGGKQPEPVHNSYATPLRILLDSSGAVGSSSEQPLKVSVALKRKNPTEAYTETVFFRELAFASGSEKAEILVDESPLAREGDYFLQLSTSAPGTGAAPLSLTTPALVTIGNRIVPEEVIPPHGFLTLATRQWPFSYRIPVQTSLPFRSADLTFEFQFAGMEDTWLTGVASVDEGGGFLRVRHPDFLPPLNGIVDGPMRFRLRCMDIDPVTWKSTSPIQMAEPYLEGIDLYWKKGANERILTGPDPALKPPFELWVRPRFRPAAELQGWWSTRQTEVSIVKTTGLAEGEPNDSPGLLMRTIALANAGRKEDFAKIRLVQNPPGGQADAPDMSEAGSTRVWGWPRVRHDDVYRILVWASYEERPFDISAAGSRNPPALPREIKECMIAGTIHVKRPFLDIPLAWGLVLLVAAVGALAQITKRWAPTLKSLGLRIYVKGDAMVAPQESNSAEVSLAHETSWADEVQVYTQYLSSRHPGWSPATVRWLTQLTVLFRRLFLPRRRLCISVRPTVDSAARDVQMALVCLWTGPKRRHGALWSSMNGVIDLSRTRTEDQELELHLSYRVDPDPEKITVPVTMCIGRA